MIDRPTMEQLNAALAAQGVSADAKLIRRTAVEAMLRHFGVLAADLMDEGRLRAELDRYGFDLTVYQPAGTGSSYRPGARFRARPKDGSNIEITRSSPEALLDKVREIAKSPRFAQRRKAPRVQQGQVAA